MKGLKPKVEIKESILWDFKKKKFLRKKQKKI